MEQNKTPIKYSLNVWKSLPGYPKPDDILYEIMQYTGRKGMGEFSMQTLNGIWYDQAGVANWEGTQIEECVNALISNGSIEMADERNGKQWYKINDPWT